MRYVIWWQTESLSGESDCHLQIRRPNAVMTAASVQDLCETCHSAGGNKDILRVKAEAGIRLTLPSVIPIATPPTALRHLFRFSISTRQTNWKTKTLCRKLRLRHTLLCPCDFRLRPNHGLQTLLPLCAPCAVSDALRGPERRLGLYYITANCPSFYTLPITAPLEPSFCFLCMLSIVSSPACQFTRRIRTTQGHQM